MVTRPEYVREEPLTGNVVYVAGARAKCTELLAENAHVRLSGVGGTILDRLADDHLLL